MITLFRKNSLGIGTWRVWAEGDTIYYASAVVEGGAETVHSKKVVTNQSGRNLAEQISLEMDSRVSRMLDKGYKHTRQDALKGSTNQLGLINPMLAKPLKDVKVMSFVNAMVQPKFDGHRCLITKQNDAVFAYSRRGKIIDNAEHITSMVSEWLPEGWTMDGELYIHGEPLQTISSIAKQSGHPRREELCFHWYDLYLVEPFHLRWQVIERMHAKHVDDERLQLTLTQSVSDIHQVHEFFADCRAQGYEGAMLRLSTKGYEPNKRTDQLIKIKECNDSEGLVVSIRPSKDGWAICRLRLANGNEFDISAPGSIPEKEEVYRNAHQYVGRRLTFEYAQLTNDGIPMHAVALRWRDDL